MRHFDAIRTLIHSEVSDGREKSMVLTKLDEAEMWLGRQTAPIPAPIPQARVTNLTASLVSSSPTKEYLDRHYRKLREESPPIPAPQQAVEEVEPPRKLVRQTVDEEIQAFLAKRQG